MYFYRNMREIELLYICRLLGSTANIVFQLKPCAYFRTALICYVFILIVFANNTGLFERFSTPRTSRTSITQQVHSPPMPKHDVVVITQSGVYPQDKIDQNFEVNNEALDIAATQVCTLCCFRG